jgi:hypothetical protein
VTCHNDLIKFSQFLNTKLHFEIFCITDDPQIAANKNNNVFEATRISFLKVWEQLKSRFDYNHEHDVTSEFILYYIGHGGAIESSNGQEECMVFLDNVMWHDDFVQGCLYTLPPSVRTMLVLDSCNAPILLPYT